MDLTHAFVLLAILVLAGGYALFNAGRRYEQTHYFAPAGSARVTPAPLPEYSERYEHADTAITPELEAAQLEVVMLPPVTGTIPIIEAGYGLMPALVLELDPVETSTTQLLADQLGEAEAEAARWRALYEAEVALAAWKDMLRARYLRLLRIERARVRAVFGDVWRRPRKPTLARLASEVIEVGTAAHPSTARLIPLPIVRELAATA